MRTLISRARSTSTQAAALALVALAAACGGSSSGGAPPASPAPQSSSTAATPAATAPADPAAAKAEITTNWEKFLSSSTSSAVARSLLEKGTSLGPALKKAAQEDKATGGARSARVTKITFTSATQANVNYILKAAGTTLNAAGVAVLEGGTWKVSDITFCTLVVLGNNQRPVKGCPS
jgi:hypothetical protein